MKKETYVTHGENGGPGNGIYFKEWIAASTFFEMDPAWVPTNNAGGNLGAAPTQGDAYGNISGRAYNSRLQQIRLVIVGSPNVNATCRMVVIRLEEETHSIAKETFAISNFFDSNNITSPLKLKKDKTTGQQWHFKVITDKTFVVPPATGPTALGRHKFMTITYKPGCLDNNPEVPGATTGYRGKGRLLFGFFASSGVEASRPLWYGNYTHVYQNL